MAHFDGCIEAIEQNSSNAKVFVLIHKMDLVPEEQRERVGVLLAAAMFVGLVMRFILIRAPHLCHRCSATSGT
jgi:hypothetical protein